MKKNKIKLQINVTIPFATQSDEKSVIDSISKNIIKDFECHIKRLDCIEFMEPNEEKYDSCSTDEIKASIKRTK